MEIYAHRGASGTYPENTLAAFEAAAKLPVAGVEFDVHLTSDGELVVIHDESINRTSNGEGFVKDLTLAELQQYDFGTWFDAKFAGEKIPTLRQVLAVFKDTTHRINIELKTDIFVYEGIAEKTLALVNEMQLQERVMISSFDHEILQQVHVQAPEIEIATLFAAVIVNMKSYIEQIPAKAIHVTTPAAFRKPVAEAIANDVTVRVYTVNEEVYAMELELLGVDAIYTDYPERMLACFA